MTSSHSPFLDLPLELRFHIYDYALSQPLHVSVSTTLVENQPNGHCEPCPQHHIPGLPANHVPVLKTLQDATPLDSQQKCALQRPEQQSQKGKEPENAKEKEPATKAGVVDRTPTEEMEEEQDGCICPVGSQFVRQKLKSLCVPSSVALALLRTNKQINVELRHHLKRHRELTQAASDAETEREWASPGTSFSSSTDSFESTSTSAPTVPRTRVTPLLWPGAGLSLSISFPYGLLVLKHLCPDLLHHAHNITIKGTWSAAKVSTRNDGTGQPTAPAVEQEENKSATYSMQCSRRALRSLTRTVLSPTPSPLLRTYFLRIFVPDSSKYSTVWSDHSPVSTALTNICGGNIDLKTKRGNDGTGVEMTVRPFPDKRYLKATFPHLSKEKVLDYKQEDEAFGLP